MLTVEAVRQRARSQRVWRLVAGSLQIDMESTDLAVLHAQERYGVVAEDRVIDPGHQRTDATVDHHVEATLDDPLIHHVPAVRAEQHESPFKVDGTTQRRTDDPIDDDHHGCSGPGQIAETTGRTPD